MLSDMLFDRSAIIKINSKHFKYAKVIIKINGFFRVLRNKVARTAADQMRFYGHNRIVIDALHKPINTLIRNTTLLYISCISSFVRGESDSINILVDDIFDKALNYGLILEKDQIERDSLFGVYYILHLAKEKANITP